jgi:two-component system response regulator AtoC
MAKVMVVDDDLESLWGCVGALKERGHSVAPCSRSGEAVELFQKHKPDLVLLDVKMPGRNGLEILRDIRAMDSRVCIVMLSAYGDSETVVKAMKEGADNFADKSLDPERLMIVIERELGRRDLERQVKELRETPQRTFATVKDIVGKSEAIELVRKKVLRYADTADVVFITGETGVGKDLVAKALHGESSRRMRPFKHTNCAGLPEGTFESAVFGHKRGAFTSAHADKAGAVEAARNGTLFLDEIGDLTPKMQAKLLLVIEARIYSKVGDEANVLSTDAFFIAATNIDVQRAVDDRSFRRDLFYRLKKARIQIPPLRERREDIMPLAEHFLNLYAAEFHTDPVGLSPRSADLLMNYDWKGNVRDLQWMMRNVVETGDEGQIEAEMLGPTADGDSLVLGVTLDDCTDLKRAVSDVTEAVEKRIIGKCLDQHGGNRRQVARRLKMSYRSLLYKMKAYGLRDNARDAN